MIYPWQACEIMEMNDRTLSAILELVKTFVDQWGRYPSVGEIKQMLLQGR